MGCLNDDLDRFLKTEGIRMMMASDKKSAAEYEPLTEEDIENLDFMVLDELGKDSLAELLTQAENLRDDLEDREPETKDSEEYNLWDKRLCAVEDFIDRIGELVEESDE